MNKIPDVHGRQAVEVAWEHFHYAKHVQKMTNEAIMRSIGRDQGRRKVPQADVIRALEHTFLMMQLWET